LPLQRGDTRHGLADLVVGDVRVDSFRDDVERFLVRSSRKSVIANEDIASRAAVLPIAAMRDSSIGPGPRREVDLVTEVSRYRTVSANAPSGRQVSAYRDVTNMPGHWSPVMRLSKRDSVGANRDDVPQGDFSSRLRG